MSFQHHHPGQMATSRRRYCYQPETWGLSEAERTTIFRVWAPTATEVYQNLYDSPSGGAHD
jgi:1,4-alpha-glucan branching enzyme